ncbi:MAG: glutamate-5-semialdehyde dehydrogenase [Candidatus Adiutrix sp.]|jgi:glutamate-5-semialdehyde dehydrogenase|nr:glutamate-5-semialdehyde dehydrogenase [Candidatus Adiutrix sp.]
MTDAPNLNLKDAAESAARAARALALAGAAARDRALAALAEGLARQRADLLEASELDVAEAEKNGLPPHLLDRLTLTEKRLAELAEAVGRVRSLPEPLGRVEDEKILPDGLKVARLRIPLGLIAFICEARPGAPVEAGALALKSGNGLIIKAGREMARTAAALAGVFARALEDQGLDRHAVTILPPLPHEALGELLTLSGAIDLVIPRGGEGLIRFVSENSRIPVLKHFKGVCHLYVDEAADLSMAADLVVNGKTQRPSTCNSLEALLVHTAVAADLLPSLGRRLAGLGVALKADPEALKFLPAAAPAAEDDWGREFLDLILAVKVVPDYEAALAHIARHGSNHTEVIVTADPDRAEHFLREAEAGCVMVNASPRLNDGGCLGLGAEIGISTTRLHAYGPMGLRELTTTRFIVTGQGHQRA